MIGVDTNVLARLLLQDDPKQSATAKRFFAKRTATDPAFVTAVVLAEFAWLLRSRYHYSLDAVHAAFLVIFGSHNVVVEREEQLKAALSAAREVGADVADAIIAATALSAGCEYVATFDRQAAKRVAGMEMLK
jgi:predicted nucleic-acid-binding protein